MKKKVVFGRIEASVNNPTVQGNNGQATGNACLSENDSAKATYDKYRLLIEFAVLDMGSGVLWAAENQLKSLSRKGCVQAMLALAMMYIYGILHESDFVLDIFPLVKKAASLNHIPSMWLIVNWLDAGVLGYPDTDLAEKYQSLLSKLDPNGEHCCLPITSDVVAESDKSVLIADIINALEYHPGDVYVPVSADFIRDMIFTKR